MKQGIHPTYYPTATITCSACSTVHLTGATKATLQTELCSNCHPFYTGKQMLIDTTGTVDRFKKRAAAAAKLQADSIPKKTRKSRDKK
jgi:large subunit ribosomal protein L31